MRGPGPAGAFWRTRLWLVTHFCSSVVTKTMFLAARLHVGHVWRFTDGAERRDRRAGCQ